MLDTLKQKIKIIGIPILGVVLIIGSVIGGVLESGKSIQASAYSGDWSSYVDLGDYIVKTDEPGAMPALTKEQLKTAIKALETNKEEYNNYIAELDTFISVQNTYKVNAAFIVAVAKKESTGGTGWSYIDENSHNWFSIQYSSKYTGSSGKSCSGGGYTWCWYDSFTEATEKFGPYMTDHDYFYFKADEITVDAISPHFAGEEWASKVKGYLDDMYAAVEVEINPGGIVSGNSFKNNKGRTFSLFNQNNYSEDYGGKTIAGCGCGLTSLSMCISGYGNQVDPPSVAKKCLSKFPGQYTWDDGFGSAGDGHVFKNYLSVYGLTGKSYGGYDKEAIKKHLQKGDPVILNVQRGKVWEIYYDAHYITVLGIRNGGKEVYLGDPNGQFGWITLNQIGGCIGYFLVESK